MREGRLWREWSARIREFGPWKRLVSRRKWEREWKVEIQRPDADLAKTVPQELKDAVANGWFVPGSTIMDIGSGGGQISAWLVEQGLHPVGCDLAQAATDLARRRFAHLEHRLEFRTLNICEDEPETGRFDAFVDRGCFHGVTDRHAYVRNVAVWGKPGARLLLFHMSGPDEPVKGTLEERRRKVEGRVRDAFEERFIVERAVPAIEPLARSAGPIPRIVHAGMVFWMTKR